MPTLRRRAPPVYSAPVTGWDIVSRIASALPGTGASTSWRRPCFEVGGKAFVTLRPRSERDRDQLTDLGRRVAEGEFVLVKVEHEPAKQALLQSEDACLSIPHLDGQGPRLQRVARQRLVGLHGVDPRDPLPEAEHTEAGLQAEVACGAQILLGASVEGSLRPAEAVVRNGITGQTMASEAAGDRLPLMLGSLNGRIAPVDELTIPVTDEGLVRGDGVFEVVRLYGGAPFALDEHYARMERSARTARLDVDFAALRAEVDGLLERHGAQDGALRLMCTRGGRRIALIEQVTEYPATIALASVTYAPTRVLDGVKSLSYCANMLCTRLAREAGADEALLVTPHGRVLEGPTAAFFCVLGGRLTTPPLDDHILDSITRRFIVELFDVDERPVARDDLRGAEEAFLASTFKEALPVHAIDDVELPAPGPLTREVGERLGAHIRAAVAA